MTPDEDRKDAKPIGYCVYCTKEVKKDEEILVQLRPIRQVAHIHCWKGQRQATRRQKWLNRGGRP